MDAKDLMVRVFQRAEQIGVLDDLPRLSGISKRRIEEIQTSSPISASEFERICRALAVDPAAMYRGEDSRPQRIPVRFRAALALDHPDPKDVRILALAAEQGRILAHLQGLMNRDSILKNHRRVLGLPDSRPTWKEGYSLGEDARGELYSEAGPIYELQQLLRDLGIHIARIRLRTKEVDAASIWEPDALPVIVLNIASERHGHPGALRATLAHELCHLLHDGGEGDLTTRVSWGAEGKGNYTEGVEVRARAFAPSFLAPREQV